MGSNSLLLCAELISPLHAVHLKGATYCHYVNFCAVAIALFCYVWLHFVKPLKIFPLLGVTA